MYKPILEIPVGIPKDFSCEELSIKLLIVSARLEHSLYIDQCYRYFCHFVRHIIVCRIMASLDKFLICSRVYYCCCYRLRPSLFIKNGSKSRTKD